MSLAFVAIKWYKFCINKDHIERFAEFGKNVWRINGEKEYIARNSIEKFQNFFFDIMKLSKTLTELVHNIERKDFEKMSESIANNYSSQKWYVSTTVNDIKNI